MIFSNSDLVVCGGRIICPCFLGHDQFRDRLPKKENITSLSTPLLRPPPMEHKLHTSKSCKFKISDNGGRDSILACLSFSASVMVTTTRCTVDSSTRPKLRTNAVRTEWEISECVVKLAESWAHCFSFGRCVVIASGGCMGSYSSLRAKLRSFEVDFRWRRPQ